MNPLDMSVEEFIESAIEYNKQNNITLTIKKPEECPVHVFAGMKKGTPCFKTISFTKKCPICDNYVCPKCYSHSINVLSRVTGYLSSVSGWGNGKLAELKDRKKYDIPNRIENIK